MPNRSFAEPAFLVRRVPRSGGPALAAATVLVRGLAVDFFFGFALALVFFLPSRASIFFLASWGGEIALAFFSRISIMVGQSSLKQSPGTAGAATGLDRHPRGAAADRAVLLREE